MFAVNQLGLTATEIQDITEALANDDFADPIGDSIREQSAKVSDYTARYIVSDDRRNRLIKPLVMFDLFTKKSQLSDSIEKAFNVAMKELENIRDGKFPELLPADPKPTGLGGGRWGSACKFKTDRTI